MDKIFTKSIVLIGGMAIGKSTTAELLHQKLKMPYFSSDAIRCDVLEKTPDYSFEKQLEIRKKEGYKGEMKFLNPYSNIAINNIIDDLKQPSILDIGTFFPDQLNKELITNLKQFKNIIFLYSNNPYEIIKRRKIDPQSELGQIYLNTLNSPIYDQLFTKKINVDKKTPEEIVNEIINSQ